MTGRDASAVGEQEIAYYVDQVTAALADLPPSTREELLEDLPEHLAEVAAEADGSLTERLGSPEAYAAELRAAASIEAPSPRPNLDQRLAVAVAGIRRRLRVTDHRLGALIGYPRASEYFRLLRPAWWVLRGYLVAMLITTVLDSPLGLFPSLGHSRLAGLLLLAAVVWGSIWLGRRSAGFTRWPRVVLGLGAGVLVLFGLVGFFSVSTQSVNDGYYQQTGYYDPMSNVQDVFVYDRQGRLLRDVRLLDQNGQPIRIGADSCHDSQSYSGQQVAPTYPYCPQNAPFEFSGAGPSPEPSPPAGAPSTSEPASGTPSSAPPASTPTSPAPTSPAATPPAGPGATPAR